MTGFYQLPFTARSIGLVGIALFVGLAATPVAAQVAAQTNGGLNLNGQNTMCSNDDGTLYIANGQDCDPGGILTGADPDQFHFLRGFQFGSGQTATVISADGTSTFGDLATFNGGAIFNGGTQFNGQANFTGFTTISQVNSGTILNSGALTTNSMNANSINVTGRGTFGGALSSASLSTGSALIATLRVAEGAELNGLTTISGRLTVTGGTTIDAGANRIQNVAGPVAGTDAANKDYVDTAVSNVQGSVTTLANIVAGQDARVSAIESVNTIQSNQISTLQGQVGSLQTSVNGLKRNIREANAGIAASVALGGTMIVPDSVVSVSFNLATYRGEQGFSGSLVGRISPKVYVNAGVAGSTIKGSTTGRVGISFGL